MKHNIRQRVINQYGLPVTKVESVNGELGSGILDKNGKEIFEGDKVKFRDSIGYVVFHDGNFILDNNRDLNDLLSGVVFDGSLEIVGNGD